VHCITARANLRRAKHGERYVVVFEQFMDACVMSTSFNKTKSTALRSWDATTSIFELRTRVPSHTASSLLQQVFVLADLRACVRTLECSGSNTTDDAVSNLDSLIVHTTIWLRASQCRQLLCNAVRHSQSNEVPYWSNGCDQHSLSNA
jgi:hypothetical protein